MADVLPQLKLPSGEWINPDRDSYTVGHRWGVRVADAGSGVPFTSRPRADDPLPISFVIKLDGTDEIQWWARWYYSDTRLGARRFVARLTLPNGVKSCVCQFTQPPEQIDNRGYWLVLRLTVDVIAELPEGTDVVWDDSEFWNDSISWGDPWS